MIIDTIITQLKTGSLANVYPKGNSQTYPAGKSSDGLINPYVLVYNDFPVNTFYLVNNSVDMYVVEAHFPVGYLTEVSKYVENEIPVLLDHKRLADVDGGDTYNFQVFVTMNISTLIEANDDKSITGGNDDGTISRFRKIFVPRRGL